MKQKIKFLMAVLCLSIFVFWWCIPTVNKWQADRLVDELCAKDGGIKIYESVIFPANKFNKYGEVYIPSKKTWKVTDHYYYTNEVAWIIPEGKHLNDIDLGRYNDKLIRASDEKLMAEGIAYIRRGGDPVGPWHPSHYTCPIHSSIKYINQITFMRSEE